VSDRKPRSRRTVSKTSQEDLISKFESGAGVSKKSQQMLDDLKQRDKSKESDVHDDPLFKTSSEIDRVLVDYIQPQPDNPRYLPVKFVRGIDSSDTKLLTNCVVCEKGLLENRLEKSNPRYNSVQREIEEIRGLAETLKHSELVHPITVWRKNMADYPIVSGHRRYYAIRFLYGGLIKVKVKIYAEKPKNLNVLRHIENFSRNDLALPDALESYSNAVLEIEALEGGVVKEGRASVIQSYLGLGKTSYYRYEKVYEFIDDVMPLAKDNIVVSLKAIYAEIKAAEKQGRDAVITYLRELKESGKFKKFDTRKPKVGRKKSFIKLPRIEVNQVTAVERLLKEDVTKLDIGIDWSKVDYKNPAEVESIVKTVVQALAK
tara:strand:+ start:223 stop:1347 length:1125 start_codon:yes stop_codon:yes gene_type:complete